MKKIMLILAIAMFTGSMLSSCGGEKTPKIDFSQTTTVYSEASLLGKTVGYVFDTINVIVIDESDFLGHYIQPIPVLLYVDGAKNLRYECVTPNMLGETQKLGTINNITLTSTLFTLGDDDGGNSVKVGGERKVISIANGVFLIFSNSESAISTAEKLQGWQKAVSIEKNRKDKPKVEEKEDPKGSVRI